MVVTAESTLQQDVSFNSALLERYQSRQPLMHGWVQQIHQAIQTSQTDPEFWGVVGHGLVVIDPDTDDLQRFLMAAAGALGGQYLRLNVEQFLECAEPLSKETFPSIVFIEPGPWLTEKEEAQELEVLRLSVTGALKAFCDKSSPLMVVSYAARYGAISELFRYRHAFDRHIFWAAPKPAHIAQDLYDLVGIDHLDSALLQNQDRLGRVLSLEFPSTRRVGMLAVAMRRRAVLQGRKASWRDLIEISANGTGEGFRGNEYIDPEHTATHEAGHAIVNIAGSGFKSIPDMVTVSYGNGTSGMVVESYQHTYETRGGNLTFAEVCQRIRICLAGRAAEELEYGIGGCSAYASQSDLENASSMAVHLVMQNGFPAGYDCKELVGTNLFSVPDGSELGETKYYDSQLRDFLAKLYQETKTILLENKSLFVVLRRELLTNRYLMREDLEAIIIRHKYDKSRMEGNNMNMYLLCFYARDKNGISSLSEEQIDEVRACFEDYDWDAGFAVEEVVTNEVVNRKLLIQFVSRKSFIFDNFDDLGSNIFTRMVGKEQFLSNLFYGGNMENVEAYFCYLGEPSDKRSKTREEIYKIEFDKFSTFTKVNCALEDILNS
jgi:hypothetical protein